MSKHHSEDYKISAVEYYLNNDITLREVCKIYKCDYRSLYRQTKRYELYNEIKRKKTIKQPYKLSKNIETYILSLVKKHVNITLLEIVKLVKKKYKSNTI